MKKLRCSFGFHKWHEHWREYHFSDKTQWFMFGGLGISLVGLAVLLAMFPSNMTEGEVIASVGAVVLPTIIGVIFGAMGNVIQDKTCLDCHKHNFSHTIWQQKNNAKRATKKKLVESAEKDYKETKQFLKVL